MKNLVVPTICVFEVYKTLVRQRDESTALNAVAFMRRGLLIDLTEGLAVVGARFSLEFKLALADSIVVATAHVHDALIWMQDADFENLPRVRYQPKA